MIKNLKMGDVLSSGDVIRCVVRSDCPGGRANLVKLQSEKLTPETPSITPNGNELSALYVTPWHPIKVSGTWRFPADLCEEAEVACDAVYSFLVKKLSLTVNERNERFIYRNGNLFDMSSSPSSSVSPCPSPCPYASSMLISGFECATLAHCILGEEVISHPFYGSLRVVEDLQRCRGWSKGFVRFGVSSSIRDLQSSGIAGTTCRTLGDCHSDHVNGSDRDNGDSIRNLCGLESSNSVNHDKSRACSGYVIRDESTGLASGFILSAEI
jgi:Hint-domain